MIKITDKYYLCVKNQYVVVELAVRTSYDKETNKITQKEVFTHPTYHSTLEDSLKCIYKRLQKDVAQNCSDNNDDIKTCIKEIQKMRTAFDDSLHILDPHLESLCSVQHEKLDNENFENNETLL